ncbi:integrase arm-type DNA-binding domain-containing protein [Burkholderia cenocepacia]|uniref:tyrosine-type recombinase/integrase n=1 Tax=Burkholderia cenocepacia TaxID=95486 RepID=UPI003EE2E86D
MLTDTALRNLKPKSKTYKASDRDGMYVTVSTVGTVTFRYDYRLNGRRETLTIGRYGLAGISLALARERLIDAKKAVAQGKSPALEKQREKRRLTAAKTFGDMLARWLADARMADSTRAMRKSIVDRDIFPVFQNRLLTEIGPDDLRALCNKVKGGGAPATAVHIRDIVKQVYAFAVLHGEKVDNPADEVKAASIATFVPKDRALSPTEIRLAFRQLESIATYPTIRLALRVVLLSTEQAEFLRGAVRERQNILIAGGTSTGKTTLANALLAEIVVRICQMLDAGVFRVERSTPVNPLSPQRCVNFWKKPVYMQSRARFLPRSMYLITTRAAGFVNISFWSRCYASGYQGIQSQEMTHSKRDGSISTNSMKRRSRSVSTSPGGQASSADFHDGRHRVKTATVLSIAGTGIVAVALSFVVDEIDSDFRTCCHE